MDSWNPWIVMWTPWTCNKNKQTLEKDKWTPWTFYGIHGLIKDLNKLQKNLKKRRNGVHGFHGKSMDLQTLVKNTKYSSSPWNWDGVHGFQMG